MQHKLSCYYYPTTVMLVDDDQPFLTNIRLGLDERLCYQVYADPYAALDFIESQTHINASLQSCMTGLDPVELDSQCHNHQSVNIDVNLIHHTIYDRHRFDELTVILVDYAMPCMTGIEFCERLKNHPVKKVMVTGQADASIAIEAFNNGIIDKFIMKNSDNFFDQINEAITSLQHEYFAEASQVTLSNIKTDPNCALAYPAFVSFFEAFFQQHHYAEYYLVDTSGSFLFVDFSGRPCWLIVKSRAEIARYLSIAEDNQAPDNIIEDLRSYRKIPFFFSHEDIQVSVDEWGRYLHPASPIPGCPEHYYAINQLPGIYSIYPEEILSQKEHLVQLQPVLSA